MATRVLIVSNAAVLPDLAPESTAERGVSLAVSAVQDHLHDAGFVVGCLEFGPDLDMALAEVTRWRPQVIFNLFEGWGDDPASEAGVALALETLRVPLTGCSARALHVAGSKHLAKAALIAAGLPTPRAEIVTELPPMSLVPLVSRLTWPVIVKPALYHGSIGIEQASVVTTQEQLAQRVETVLGRYQGPVLIEEFIPGREFTIAVIETPGLVALPAMEFEFVDASGGRWPVLTYEAKWCPDSPEYHATPARHDACISPLLKRRMQQLACRAFIRLGCRGCARIDFRVDAFGEAWILEVNPNPDLSPSACLAGALEAAGLDYGQLIVALVQGALARGPALASGLAGEPDEFVLSAARSGGMPDEHLGIREGA